MSDDNGVTRRGTMAAAGGLGLAALLQGGVAAQDGEGEDWSDIGESEDIYIPLFQIPVNDFRLHPKDEFASSERVVVPLSTLDYVFPFYVSISGRMKCSDSRQKSFRTFSVGIAEEEDTKPLKGGRIILNGEDPLEETHIRGYSPEDVPVVESGDELYFDGPKLKITDRETREFVLVARHRSYEGLWVRFESLSLNVWARLRRDVLTGMGQ